MELVRAIFSAVSTAAEVLGKSDGNLVNLVQTAPSNGSGESRFYNGAVIRLLWKKLPIFAMLQRSFSPESCLTIWILSRLNLHLLAAFEMQEKGVQMVEDMESCRLRLGNSENAYRMVKSLVNFVDAEISCP
ncbi:hypothetical protein MLD38_026906 [Melastoma candidum]|uniref:Uncharacterized protein n=1 Tax=Melastoma candidum TaxID=119954 RepID=A0ACB9P0J4_9MYRT|nr:hypothetical protein MLD38_026906 [Melastoma candidum]